MTRSALSREEATSKAQAERVVSYSASQWETHARCERAWWFERVVGLPTLSSPAQVIGTAFASCAERWLDGEDPHPTGWDEGLTPVDADMIRVMLAKGVEKGVLSRIPGQLVEAGFDDPVLDAEVACATCATSLDSGEICFGGEHQWIGLPAVRVKGYPDVCDPEPLDGSDPGVSDHKTTKAGFGYAKTPEELRQNLQLLSYGRAVLVHRREKGLPDPSFVRLGHNTFEKKSYEPRVETRWADPPLTPEEIDDAWRERVAQSQRMRWLQVTKRPETDLHADVLWNMIPASGTTLDAKHRRRGTPCGAFGGCPFAEICGDGGDRPSLYRKRITRIMENEERKARGLPPLVEEEIVMSNIFAGLLPPTNGAAAPAQAPAPAAQQTPVAGPFANLLGASASAPVAPQQVAPTQQYHAPTPQYHAATAVMAGANPFAAMLGLTPTAPAPAQVSDPAAAQPTPAAAPASNPFAAMLGLGASAPAPAAAQAPATAPQQAAPVKKLREIWPGCPPWARQDCSSCYHKGPDGIERTTGLNTQGGPCRICLNMNQSEGRITPYMFEYGLQDGKFWWEVRKENAERIEKECAGRAGGDVAYPVAGSAVAAAPVQALLDAPTPPAAAAPVAPPVMAASVPVVQHTQAVVVQASAVEKPSRTRTKKGFTLLKKCLPAGGGKFVRLDELFAKYASLLAEQHGKSPSAGYWELDPKTRQSQLGSIVPQIVEAEKVGSGYVVATNLVLPDVEAFYAAFALHADEEIVGL